jgi:quercetin dioxygenase-like cupin family protein
MTPDELRARLEADGAKDGVGPGAADRIPVQVWANGPGERYGEHRHDYDKVLVCDAGTIIFLVGSGERVELEEGDRLDLPAGTDHAAIVGHEGVRCLEAHLPAGSLTRLQRTAGPVEA